jgi:hypothetical protein
MDATLFLAKLIGFTFVIVSLSMLFKKNKVIQAIKSLLKNDGLLYLLEITSMGLGLAIVISANIWSGWVLPVVISLIGWVLLLKGITGLFLSNLSLRKLYYLVRFEEICYPLAIFILIVGIYLIVAGFTVPVPTL